MESVFSNGGIIGATLDRNSTEEHTDHISSIALGYFEPVFVGGGSVTATSIATTNTINFPTLSGGVSTAPIAGDVVFVSFSASRTSDIALSSTWTEISDLYANDTEDTNLAVYYKTMGETPDTNIVITSSASTTEASTIAIFHVWRNLDATTPIDVTSVTTIGSNSAVPVFSSITPVTENSVILVIASSATKESTTFYTNSLQNMVQRSITDTSLPVYTIAGIGSYSGWTSGTYTSPSWGYATTSTSMSYATTVVALRPAYGTRNYYNKKNSGIWNLEASFDSTTPVYSGAFNAWELNTFPSSGYYLGGAVATFAGIETVIVSGPYTGQTGTGTSIRTSTTGATGGWSSGTLPNTSRWATFMSNGSRIVAVAGHATTSASTCIYTDNGTTWTSVTTGLASSQNVGGYMNGKFTIVNRTTTGAANYAESTDGITWSIAQIGPTGYYGIAYLDGTYIAIPNNSTNARKSTSPLSSWTDSTLTTAADWSSIASGNGAFVAVASNSAVTNYTLDEGNTWNAGSLPSVLDSATGAKVHYINNSFVVMTLDGLIHKSSDGITWTTITASAFSGISLIREMAETSTHYYAIGNNALAQNYIRSPK